MTQHYRHYWGPQFSNRFNFQWNIIRHTSFVAITASEGGGYEVSPAPQRFVGSALFQVCSIAPHEGGVTFSVMIVDPTAIVSGEGYRAVALWPSALRLWTDITVFDASDPWGQN
jgi:hypothetical protein